MWPRGLAVAERLWSAREVVLTPNLTVARLQKASCQASETLGSQPLVVKISGNAYNEITLASRSVEHGAGGGREGGREGGR